MGLLQPCFDVLLNAKSLEGCPGPFQNERTERLVVFHFSYFVLFCSCFGFGFDKGTLRTCLHLLKQL